MPEFLKLCSLAEARGILFQNLGAPSLETEVIDTLQAGRRVLSQAIHAEEDLPAFTRSSVDGFAVRSLDTFGTSDSLPGYLKLVGEVEMGKVPSLVIGKGQTSIVHTGGMIPAGTDAVVMMEFTQTLDTNEIEIHKPVSNGENLILKGEDVRIGDTVISSGTRIRPEEIGGLLALGLTRIAVYAQPVVHIFSSGDELIPAGSTPNPGQVRDINAPMLAALVDTCGGIPKMHAILPDVPSKLEDAIREVYDESDLIIVTAGSSTSSRDMTAEVINRFGKPGVLVHGINIRPGKPTILAVCGGKPMVGLPGNPVSALVIARLLVKPLMELLSGIQGPATEPKMLAKLKINLSSVAGREEYLPVRVYEDNGILMAEPIFFKSNLIFSLVRANGLARIPADSTGYSAGDQIEILLV